MKLTAKRMKKTQRKTRSKLLLVTKKRSTRVKDYWREWPSKN